MVGVRALGEGVSDEAIAAYAAQEGRIVVTHDSDFTRLDPTAHAGVFFVADQRLSAHEIAAIVEAVVELTASRAELDGVLFPTRDWLD